MRVMCCVLAVVLPAIPISGCALKDPGRLTQASFSTLHGTPPFVDLSDRVAECPRRFRRQHAFGTIELCHSRQLSSQIVDQVAEDYGAYFDLARSTLGAGEHVTLHATLLDFEEPPESYRYTAERRGDSWRTRWVTVLLMQRDAPREHSEYWKQIRTDVHEMTHAFMGDGKQSCDDLRPTMRWLKDGIAELMVERYLQARAPQRLDDWYDNRALILEKYPLEHVDRLFFWRQHESETPTYESAAQQASYYVASHRLVRHLFDLEGGPYLRDFSDRVYAQPARSRAEMKAALFESFPELTEAELVDLVR